MDNLPLNLLQLRANHLYCDSGALAGDGHSVGSLGTVEETVQCSASRTSVVVKTVDDLQTMVKEEFKRTSMKDRVGDLPRFALEEVDLGRQLGKGAFGEVTEVRRLYLTLSSEKQYASSCEGDSGDMAALFDAGEATSRHFLSLHCTRPDNGQTRFVLKQLKPELVEYDAIALQGISDLQRETFFLKRIQHPNIVKIRAVSYGTEFDHGYFIILDRLRDTLVDLLDSWKRERKRERKPLSGLLRPNRDNHELTESVVRISFELSSALTHVHRNDIVYRDLKPANVGFDFHGRVRLFDFGLAKELSRSATFHSNAVYNLTKMSGTPRFMACEVANGLPYNEKCDVYSFSLLCWQMATLKKPYEGYTIGKLEREAWQPPFLRPKIHSKWPLWFRKLLSIGWSADIRERPSMHDVESLLAEQVSHFDGNFDLANHLSPHRRSTLAVAEERFHRENGLSCR